MIRMNLTAGGKPDQHQARQNDVTAQVGRWDLPLTGHGPM